MGDGHYAELERSSWGYFKAVNLPAGTQTYRVTDIYGHVLEDSGIVVLDEGEIDGHDQFPPCTPPSDGSYDRSLVGRLSRRPTTCGRSLSVSSTCAVSARHPRAALGPAAGRGAARSATARPRRARPAAATGRGPGVKRVTPRPRAAPAHARLGTIVSSGLLDRRRARPGLAGTEPSTEDVARMSARRSSDAPLPRPLA